MKTIIARAATVATFLMSTACVSTQQTELVQQRASMEATCAYSEGKPFGETWHCIKANLPTNELTGDLRTRFFIGGDAIAERVTLNKITYLEGKAALADLIVGIQATAETQRANREAARPKICMRYSFGVVCT